MKDQQGGWPQDCSTEQADPSLIDSMLSIMPSAQLVAHEWRKQPACSGLSPKDYFAEATDAFNGTTIASRYQAPRQQIVTSPWPIRK